MEELQCLTGPSRCSGAASACSTVESLPPVFAWAGPSATISALAAATQDRSDAACTPASACCALNGRCFTSAASRNDCYGPVADLCCGGLAPSGTCQQCSPRLPMVHLRRCCGPTRLRCSCPVVVDAPSSHMQPARSQSAQADSVSVRTSLHSAAAAAAAAATSAAAAAAGGCHGAAGPTGHAWVSCGGARSDRVLLHPAAMASRCRLVCACRVLGLLHRGWHWLWPFLFSRRCVCVPVRCPAV